MSRHEYWIIGSTIMRALAMLTMLMVGCGTEPGAPGDAQDTSPDAAGNSDASVDAPPEPMPVFRISTVHGALAVDDAGIRGEFRLDGVMRLSTFDVNLTADGATTWCKVSLTPVSTGFAVRSTSTRRFKVVLLNPGAGPVIADECHWDDAYMLQRLATLGPIEVGWAQARFEEDRPLLDLYNGGPWLPAGTASMTYPGAVNGFAMAADGTATSSVRVQPLPGTLDPGVYFY
jgi:hypothetical protein